MLWAEYRAGCPDGFGYTWFTEHYRAWAGKLDVVLRQEHRVGEKLFLDFAGQTIQITDPLTGEITGAQLFVAVLGASNYTDAEALPSQAEVHWLGAHVRGFEFFSLGQSEPAPTWVGVPVDQKSYLARLAEVRTGVDPDRCRPAGRRGAR